MAISVDPDQMLHSTSSDLGQHYLPKLAFPNTERKYGKHISVTRENTNLYKELHTDLVSNWTSPLHDMGSINGH